MKGKTIILSVFLGLGLTFAFLVLIKTTAGAAPGDTSAIRCVKPSGGACYTTIQAAVNGSVNGDTIRVAQGTYHETVTIAKSVIVEGGWNSTFTARDWDTYITTIDADGAGTAIYLDGNPVPISPTIDGFHIIDGDGSAFLGWGGGILADGEWDNPGLITIRNNTITDNVACRLNNCQGYGGGIMVYSNRSIIEDNTIISNTARASGRGSGQGGGIAIWGWPTEATLTGNHIISNTAVISTTGEFGDGEGGGLWSDGSAEVVVTGNEIIDNLAAGKGTGKGGGVYCGCNLSTNNILSNTASLDGAGYGGGVNAYYTAEFHHNLIQGNVASKNAAGNGGGIYATYLQNAYGNTIVDNKATNGGGVYFHVYSGHQQFYDNLVARNQATGLDTGAPDGGGGILNEADWVEITNNEIYTNTALAGGGVLTRAGTRLLLQENLLRSNIAVAGGGMYLHNTGGEVLQNQIRGNGVYWWGGGLYLTGSSSPTLDRNLVVNNTALGYSGFAGGGIIVAVDSSTHVTMTNTVIANNTINTGVAGGMHCYSGSCSLIHCTIVDNKIGASPGEGVRISATGGTNVVWNSIIVGHSTGVVLGGSPVVTLDYNDYFNNTVNASGVSAGTHSLFVDPLFVNWATGDYHLTQSSPLINMGNSGLSIAHDYDGKPRILGPDIGADEFILGRIFLPVLLKNYSPCPGGC